MLALGRRVPRAAGLPMCYEIAQLYQSVASYAARFDAALVAPEELGQVVYYAGRIEKLAGHIASFAAARLAGGAGNDGPGPRHDLARQAAEQLARATGTTLGTARKAVEVARRLQRQPEVAGAVRAGELSRAQAELVSSAVEAALRPRPGSWRWPGRARLRSWLRRRAGPRPPPRTSKPAASGCTQAAACAPTPALVALGTSTPRACQRTGPGSWPGSSALPTKPSTKPARLGATSAQKPTRSTAWSSWRPRARGRPPATRSWCG